MIPISKKANVIQENDQKITLLIINGLNALSSSFMIPIMSLFLIAHINTEPFYIGVYTIVTSLLTLIASRKITDSLDNNGSSKFLYIFCTVCTGVAGLGFAYSSEFWHVMLVGALFMPFSASIIPVTLTIIRNYADSQGSDADKINSQMRASVSLLWIVGPPVTFFISDKFGIKWSFLSATFISIFVIALSLIYLEDSKKEDIKEISHTSISSIVYLLGTCMLLANLANSAYLSAIPLYLTEELNYPASYSGILLGVTAAVEIPAILLAAYLARRLNKMNVILGGLVCGTVSYIMMYFNSGFDVLVAVQLLNGFFFGSFVSLGITAMQDLAPSSIGRASSIYSNSMLLGSLLGASFMGIVAQFYSYQDVLLLCSISTILAMILISLFLKNKKL